MSDKQDVELGLQYAAESRKSEIALLWSRSLYFWGLITVLLAAYGTSFQHGHKTLATFAGCFGILCSLSWSLANRSSKYWQEVWEKKVEHWEDLAIERGALPQRLFNSLTNPVVNERWFWGGKKFSPSKLVMAISDFSVVGWVLLVLGVIVSRLSQGDHNFQIAAAGIGTFAALVLTVIGSILLLFWCRSGEPMELADARNIITRSLHKIDRGFAGLNSKGDTAPHPTNLPPGSSSPIVN